MRSTLVFCLLTLMTAALRCTEAESPLNWAPLPPIPDAEGFAGGMAGVSHGVLLFAGGSNFIGKRPWEGGTKRYYDAVYWLDSPRGYWRRAGTLPRPTGYAVSGTFRDEFFIAGGGDLPETYNQVYALSWDGSGLRRRDLPPLPRHRSFAGGTVAGHWLYVVGGTEASQFTAVEAMRDGWALDLADPASGWQALPPLPGPGRSYPMAAAVGEAFYLFGGTALRPDQAGKAVRTFLSDGYEYRAGRGWARTADLPHPLAGGPTPAAVTGSGRILFFSGDDGTRITLDGPNHPGFPEKTLLFDPAANRWSALPDVPFSRSTAATAVWNGMWVMTGGERKPGYRTPETWGLRLEGL